MAQKMESEEVYEVERNLVQDFEMLVISQPVNELQLVQSFETLRLTPSTAAPHGSQQPQEQVVPDTQGPKDPLIYHSRQFRDYCDHRKSYTLEFLTDELLRELRRVQSRSYASNTEKARVRRRFIVGFRQVLNSLEAGNIKLAVIATDCDLRPPGCVDKTIEMLKQKCQNQNVPYVFSLRRRQLAYALFKKGSVSCVGVLKQTADNKILTSLIQKLKEEREYFAKYK